MADAEPAARQEVTMIWFRNAVVLTAIVAAIADAGHFLG